MLDVREDGALVERVPESPGEARPQGHHQWSPGVRRQRSREGHGDVRSHRAGFHPSRKSRSETTEAYDVSPHEGLHHAEQVQGAGERFRARCIECKHSGEGRGDPGTSRSLRAALSRNYCVIEECQREESTHHGRTGPHTQPARRQHLPPAAAAADTASDGGTALLATDDDVILESLISCVVPSDDDREYIDNVVAVVKEAKIPVAMDSGSCENVIHPDDLPEGFKVIPNAPDVQHFKGANDSHIERYGTIETVMRQDGKQPIRGDWVGADVSRALHSVSKVCGKPTAPKQDVLFDADNCFVVAPGIVKQIMKQIKAIAEYQRLGGLYVAEMTVSSFTRPGASA